MKCKNCGGYLTWGIDPDEYLFSSVRGNGKDIKESYYHEYGHRLTNKPFCYKGEPDYKFKDYIKKCKRNARSVKSQ